MMMIGEGEEAEEEEEVLSVTAQLRNHGSSQFKN